MAAVTDEDIERIVSVVLRSGVILSGSVVLLGGVYYLARHGGEPVNYQIFRPPTPSRRYLLETVHGAWSGSGRSMIQLGILCLIATPIARVAVSLIGFALERDRVYILITSLVLVILLYSLIFGAAGAA